MNPLNHEVIKILFYSTAALGLSTKFYKWFNMKKIKNDSLNKIQIVYLICHFSFTSGFIFQGPYVHQRYHENGMTSDQINDIMSIFNIVSAFWGFFVGYACEILGHKTLIVLSAIFLSTHSVLRYIGGFYFFIIASVLQGLSTASNRVVFEDWLALQLEQTKQDRGAMSVVKENSALLNLILTIVMTPVSQKLTTKYGVSAAFSGSALLFAFSAIIVILLLPKPLQSNAKRQKSGFFGAFVRIASNMGTSFSFSTTIFLDLFYTMFGLLYHPRWLSFHKATKDEKLPLSQISTTNSISQLNGAQITSAIVSILSFNSTLILGFGSSTVSMILMYYLYNDKNYVTLFYALASTFDGSVNSCMSSIRASQYPDDVRKHLLGILRVPASLIVTMLLQKLKGIEADSILFICISISLLCLVLSLLLRILEGRKGSKTK